MNKKLLVFSALFLATMMVTMTLLSSSLTVVGQEPFVGGVFNTAMGSDALTLNPYTWGSTYEANVIGHVYDALVQFDINNQPVPVLCSSWNYSETYETWTFTLRENAVWHDGTPVTAYDVEYTWDLLWNDPAIPRRGWMYDEIESITVLNDLQIQVVFLWGPKPEDVLIEFASDWILPEHIWSDPTIVSDFYTFANEEPIGCGPFKLVEWAHGQFFRFERNPDYYLEGPWVEEKVIHLITEVESTYYALSVGDIEVMGAVPPELEALAEVDPNIEIHEYLADYQMYLGVNQRRYPNNITEFRQAVLYGINKSAVIEIAGFGRGVVCPASMSLPWGPWYNPDVAQYPYNLALANSMLDALGFLDTDDDDIREDGNGDPLEFELLVSAEYQESVDSAKLIQADMELLGIDVTLKPVLFDILWAAVGGPGGTYPGKYDYDWAYLGWVEFWSDRHPNWMAWMFNIDMWWGSDDVNIPGWNSSVRYEVHDLTEQIMYETDEAVVKDLLDEAQELVAEDLPYLPIRVLGGIALYRIDEFTGWLMGNVSGPNNWQSWLVLHLVAAPQPTPGFEIITAALAIVFTVGIGSYLKRRRRK